MSMFQVVIFNTWSPQSSHMELDLTPCFCDPCFWEIQYLFTFFLLIMISHSPPTKSKNKNPKRTKQLRGNLD